MADANTEGELMDFANVDVMSNGIRGNHRPSHPSALSSPVTYFPLLSPSVHSILILSLLLLCVVGLCSFLSNVLSLACPHTGKQTEGQVWVCL